MRKTTLGIAVALGLMSGSAQAANIVEVAQGAGTVEDLLKPENKAKLTAVLSYHVLARKLMSNQLPGRTIHLRTVKSSGDRLLAVSKSSSGVTVDQANVVTADIATSYGVVHVIDEVMLPDSQATGFTCRSSEREK